MKISTLVLAAIIAVTPFAAKAEDAQGREEPAANARQRLYLGYLWD